MRQSKRKRSEIRADTSAVRATLFCVRPDHNALTVSDMVCNYTIDAAVDGEVCALLAHKFYIDSVSILRTAPREVGKKERGYGAAARSSSQSAEIFRKLYFYGVPFSAVYTVKKYN